MRLKSHIVSLGCKLSSMDNSFFMVHQKGVLVGLILAFVDDLLWGGNSFFKEEVIVKLKEALNVGSEQSSAFRYIGINMTQDEHGSIRISQESYIESMKPVLISKERLSQKDEKLTRSEKKQLRGVMGQINWVSGISRPDIGFTAGLVCTSKEAEVTDLIEANKLVKHVKNSPTDILFPRLDNLKDAYLKVYTDASYGNLRDGGSQGGHIVFVTDGVHTSPLVWHSRKVRRVVKSTIAAETLALVDGCETAFFLSKLLAEVVSGDADDSKPVVCVTDNQSLFESAHSTHVLTDKWLQIEMAIVTQMISREELKLEWCPADQQASDVVTKKGASGVTLREMLSRGHI